MSKNDVPPLIRHEYKSHMDCVSCREGERPGAIGVVGEAIICMLWQVFRRKGRGTIHGMTSYWHKQL